MVILDEQKRRRIINLLVKEMSQVTTNLIQMETSLAYAEYQLEQFKEKEGNTNNTELVPIQQRKINDFKQIQEVYQTEIKFLEEIKDELLKEEEEES
ncbi:MAG TPA: hypothetical protein VFP25_01860 [Nitrososphaeraceae archaeon]|nr:hypothetical protein [Nitrososphaeraceae archaeon]